MSEANKDLCYFVIAILACGMGLAEHMPPWAMMLLGALAGAKGVFTLSDYRDVERRRAGVLIDNP